MRAGKPGRRESTRLSKELRLVVGRVSRGEHIFGNINKEFEP